MKELLKRPSLLYIIIAILLLGNIILGYQVMEIKKLEKLKEGYEMDLKDTDSFTFFEPIYTGNQIRKVTLANNVPNEEELEKIFPDTEVFGEAYTRVSFWVANVENYYDYPNGQELVDKLLEEESDYIFRGLNLTKDQVLWLRKNVNAKIEDIKTGEVLLKWKY